jgi:hypothetical protein
VHLSHYMFRPRLAVIFRWFVNTKNIFKVVTIYSTDPLSRVCCFSAVCICCITTIFAYICLLNGSVEYIVTTLNIFFVYEPSEDGHQMGPKHVVISAQ